MNRESKTAYIQLRRRDISPVLLLALAMLGSLACRTTSDNSNSNSLRNVPAERLAYTFTPDAGPPPGDQANEATNLKGIQDDFDSRRKVDRLLRTVVSPDGQRALAVYDTGETQEGEFQIDLYASDGRMLRRLTPPELSGAFATAVSWSPDGKSIAFIGRKSLTQPTPPDMIPEGAPTTSPTVVPLFAPVPVFDSEQIYVADRDGFQLRPLTTRNGLIYFFLAWAPDSHALTALACRENEWEAREREHKAPAGRPRLIETDGRERLLDDGSTEAAPAWSPDSAKIAAGFDTEVKIYDAVAATPSQAVIQLREPLLNASTIYDEKNLASKNSNGQSSGNKSGGASQPSGVPVSFNPIVKLTWPEERTLYLQTAYVRIYATEPVITFQRWHKISLSKQAEGTKVADARRFDVRQALACRFSATN
jgi:hypothetical protein